MNLTGKEHLAGPRGETISSHPTKKEKLAQKMDTAPNLTLRISIKFCKNASFSVSLKYPVLLVFLVFYFDYYIYSCKKAEKG